MLERALLDRTLRGGQVAKDNVAGFNQLQRLCGVDDVGRGETEVQPAGSRPSVLGHRRREGDHIVLRDLFDLFDARDVESRLGSQSVAASLGIRPASAIASAAASSTWSQVSYLCWSLQIRPISGCV